MSKGGRLSRFLPKLFRSDSKKAGSSPSMKGPSCLIVYLDDSEENVIYKNSWKGQTLFNVACDKINLSEKDYFGLRFVDNSGQAHWVELTKSLSSQLKGCSVPHKFYFGVKFYAADPCKLHEEITRYLFFLQVKRDILQGRLPVSFEDASELCAYAVQSELGDFDLRTHTAGYVSEFCFLPNQTEDLEARITAMHRRCLGATPVMAEHRFLERVRWLDMYGVDLHPVQGEGNIEYYLGLTPTGIVVYKHKAKVASYFWPRLTKATHKGKLFTIKVKDKNNEEHVYAFELPTKAACKHLWKCCIEHHTFFSGRSERLAARESRSKEQPLVRRAPSRRQPRRMNSDSKLNKEQFYYDQFTSQGRGLVTMMGQPEPIRAPRHRSLPELHGRQSPRSVKSAPWESKFDHGLYTSGHGSPTSDKKGGRHPSFGSEGSDSESGVSHRKRYFPNRKCSDNESDASTTRRRRREMDSDSGSEVSFANSAQSRKKRYAQTHKDLQAMNLLYPFRDKENNPHGSIPSLHSAPAGEVKQRRRRRRSKSPSSSKRPPDELKQHIEFNLVDTEGMSQEQLQDISYTRVETKANLFKVKYSPKFRQKIWASRRKSFGDADKNTKPAQSLSRQDSWNTDPAGAYAYSERIVGGYTNGQLSRHSDVQQQEDRKPQDPSPGQSNGHSTPTSRAYLNPVYLNHDDAQQGLAANNHRNGRVSSQFGSEHYSSQGYKSDHRSGGQHTASRLSYREQVKHSSSLQGQQIPDDRQEQKQQSLESSRESQLRFNHRHQYSESNSFEGLPSNSPHQQNYNSQVASRLSGTLNSAQNHNQDYSFNSTKSQVPQSQTPSSGYSDTTLRSSHGGISTPPRGTDRSNTDPRPVPPKQGLYHCSDKVFPQASYSGRSGSSSGYGGSQNHHSRGCSDPVSSQQQMRSTYNTYNSHYGGHHHQDQNSQYLTSPAPLQGTEKSSYNVPSHNQETPVIRQGYSYSKHPSSYRSDLVTQL